MEWWQVIAGGRAIGDVPAVQEITHDSRMVKPGWVFVAVPGRRSDGHDYIESAVRAGTPAVVVQADRESIWSPFAGRVPLIVVPDSRAALGPLAAAVYGQPSQTLRLIGVTGTDGKTTTTHLIAHVLQSCGFACGYLSSASFDTGGGSEQNASHMTTLEPSAIQALLARALGRGCRSMVVEASSEGLAQHRLDGCTFDVAVFTNLTRDHLDFHGTMENYLAAKGLLFEKLDEASAKRFPRVAVLNADDAACYYLATRTSAPKITYGIAAAADIGAIDLRSQEQGLSFTIRSKGRSLAATLPMLGSFNVSNALAAVAVAIGQGGSLDRAVEALSDFAGVPGRLERIDCGQPFSVFVDIASTPAALENVLRSLRPATSGRLWVVFGAAGERDTARRNGMGRVAAILADRAVLTNEDPREEDPEAIIDAIAAGLSEASRSEGRDFSRVPDRRDAIRFAFENASPGDTVLLAGKATETTMVIGGKHVPWDERAVARELLGDHS